LTMDLDHIFDDINQKYQIYVDNKSILYFSR
jgi:hypothetical protein